MNDFTSITPRILGVSLQEVTVVIPAPDGAAAVKAADAWISRYVEREALVNSTSYRDEIKNNGDGTFTVRYF